MSSYLLVFTVSNDCKCLGCRGTPWRGPGEPARCWASDTRECLISVLPWPQPCKESGERSSESAFGIPESLWLSRSLADVLLAALSNIYFRDGRVPRSPPGDSRWQRGITLPLRLLFFRLASCVTDKKFVVCLLFPGLISKEGCMLMKFVDYIHGTIQV